MDPQELKNLIDRYLKNDVTDRERQLVDEWYRSYDDSSEILSAEKETQLKKEIYANIKERTSQPQAKVRRLNITRYAAAAATVLLVTAAIFSRRQAARSGSTPELFTDIKTGTGQVRRLELPDGSVVWLNAKSNIRVSQDFEKKNDRNVYLDEGEAFFEVTKNPHRPFWVITPSISTRVLGTSFNVKAYKGLDNAIVTVRTGRVQVSDKKTTLAVLLPDQRITYSLNKQTAFVSTADAGSSRSWIDGHTVLNNVSFKELAQAFNNVYGVRLISKNKLTNNYKYNMIISSSRTIDETASIICSVHQNSFRRKNNEVIIY